MPIFYPFFACRRRVRVDDGMKPLDVMAVHMNGVPHRCCDLAHSQRAFFSWQFKVALALALVVLVSVRAVYGNGPTPTPSNASCTAWIDATYPLLPPGGAEAAIVAARSSVVPSQSLSQAQAPLDALIVVPSGGIEGVARRAIVRAAFAQSAALVPWAHVKLLFVVTPASALLGSAFYAGESSAGDLLYAVGCADHDWPGEPLEHSSTTCKVLFALTHAAATYKTLRFFVRSGDDAHFRIDQFMLRIAPRHVDDSLPSSRALAPAPAPHFVMGSWYTPSDENPTNNLEAKWGNLKAAYGIAGWPRYPSGMGYVLGGGVARALAAVHAAVGLADGFPEDGLVGMWVAGMSLRNVARIHSPCFYNYRLHSCRDDGILVHYMTKDTWALVGKDGRQPVSPCQSNDLASGHLIAANFTGGGH